MTVITSQKFLLLLVLVLCSPLVAHAQGGACPTGANYINPANGGVLGPLVTLSAIGVTKCFYIAASGSDTNTGTSETYPWLHAPGMPNCASNCAALTPAAGDGFIFRGGDTWHYFTGSPQVGTTGSPAYYGWDFKWNGTSSNYIYIGRDPAWFTGSVWARPIFNDDNPVVAGGIVSSCLYPMANFTNVAIQALYVWFDNFEFTGMCWNDVPNNTNVHAYLGHGNNAISYVGLSNNYLHGWTHVAFTVNSLATAHTSIASGGTGYAIGDTCTVNGGGLGGGLGVAMCQVTAIGGTGPTGPATVVSITYGGAQYPTSGFPVIETTRATSGSGSGLTLSIRATVPESCIPSILQGVCNNANLIRGGTAENVGTQILFNVLDGSDSDDQSMSGIDSDGWITAYNVIRHLGGTQIIDNCHSIHDNLFEYINNDTTGSTHSDMWFCNGEAAGMNNFNYNNLVRFIATEYPSGGNLSCIFWWTPSGRFTDYIFNNVGHDINCSGNCNNFNPPGSPSTALVFNNTWESMNNVAIWANGIVSNITFTDANNHYITNNGTGCAAVYAKPSKVNGGVATCSGDVFQTISAANAQGYTSSTDYRLLSGSGATVGAAENESRLASVFGSAFLSTTANGCTYIARNHTVSCPGITSLKRPATANWDAGAFQFLGSVTTLPISHTFTNTLAGNTSADSPFSFIISNNSGAVISLSAPLVATANFSAMSGGSRPCTSTLANAATCTVIASFSPQITASGSLFDTLSVTYSGGGAGTLTASIAGRAIAVRVQASTPSVVGATNQAASHAGFFKLEELDERN